MTSMQVTSKVTGWIDIAFQMHQKRIMSNKSPHDILMHDLPVEWNAHRTQQETGILVCLGSSVQGNVATGNHLGRVPAHC